MASTGSSSSATAEAPAPAAVDVFVGIAGWNNAATIGSVAGSIAQALGRYGPAAGVVLADGGSTDGTIDRAREALAAMPAVVATGFVRPASDPLRAPYHGLPGRPAALQGILREAASRGAKAVAVVDAGLTSVTPDWITRLVEPVLAGGYDFVSPVHLRQPHEGALTRSIVYPLFRALYGMRLRQPAAGDFGCSRRFAQHVLDQDVWTGDASETGIDVWLEAEAATGGFKVCEVPLGPRTRAPTAESPDLSAIVTQVVGALFADLAARPAVWQRIRGSVPVPSVGGPLPFAAASPLPDPAPMLEAFRLGYTALGDLWSGLLEPRMLLHLKRLAAAPSERFRIDDGLWAQIVYDFALAYGLRTMPREHLLGALTPLYLGWLAGYLLELGGAEAVDADARVERLCLAFEARKSYLIAGWRWPERFRA
jgi:hypothetical protein